MSGLRRVSHMTSRGGMQRSRSQMQTRSSWRPKSLRPPAQPSVRWLVDDSSRLRTTLDGSKPSGDIRGDLLRPGSVTEEKFCQGGSS